MRKLAVVALAALAFVACNDSTHSAAPAKPESVAVATTTTTAQAERVASFSGPGTQQTTPFDISPYALSWRITWSMTGRANVITLKTADGTNVAQVLNHVGETLGHANRKGAGSYFLTIETDSTWSAFVDQTVPGSQIAPRELQAAPTTTPTTAYVPPTTVYIPPPTTVYRPPVTAPPPQSCPNGSYINSSGNSVCSPYASPSGPPAGATAQCRDGTYSSSQHRQGTCSGHGGVAQWL